ncbi:TIGR01459 family HAD-type hydrolase [Acidocella sp.]|uniref:TIGR01459 family HAD-type hydrolase n=1 Tax=Acidocella sp. TaxID=50710 RepID=UPI00263344EF|nr:TIGR01459 family HAD-type hydrolase [Acidocella sp.]MDD2795849.1 TIGR01459 family HAD-type hydrolase [Acidocella sp.]
MTGFGALAQNYDGFIVDLWGVVHDGVKPYPGVLDCLSRLRGAGKTVVFLSNAPRRPDFIAATLGAMGIGPSLYTGIMSSGEAVHLALRDRTDEFAALGSKLYHLGPARDRGVFDTLPLEQVDDPAAADFLLNTGPDDVLGPQDPALYAPVLQAALRAGIPMVCANPDLEVVRDGVRIICAGLLAEYYKADGGTVIQRGKPDPAIYKPTLAMLATTPARTLAIGDSLRTDIAGAKAAGIASCWVLSGIHALHPDAAPQEAAQLGLAPVSILPGFSW